MNNVTAYSSEDVIRFVHQFAKGNDITDSTMLSEDLQLWGDDLDEFLAEYAKRFSVDMTNYLWYFHNREEGWNLGAAFVIPPNERVHHIPISIGMLRDFANTGRWMVDYPEHQLPKWRIDTALTLAALVAALLAVVVYVCNKGA